MAKSASDLVGEAKGKVENLDPDAVEGELANGAVLVDLREADELDANGRIPGAVHVPRGMLEFRADPESPYHDQSFDRDKTVILYCASGGRSALAGKTLKDLGYRDVRNLGAFKDWAESGRPVERV